MIYVNPVMANHSHVLLIKTKISYETNFIHILICDETKIPTLLTK
jgi:hypothetical protein